MKNKNFLKLFPCVCLEALLLRTKYKYADIIRVIIEILLFKPWRLAAQNTLFQKSMDHASNKKITPSPLDCRLAWLPFLHQSAVRRSVRHCFVHLKVLMCQNQLLSAQVNILWSFIRRMCLQGMTGPNFGLITSIWQILWKCVVIVSTFFVRVCIVL